jgi:hypothetical protein
LGRLKLMRNRITRRLSPVQEHFKHVLVEQNRPIISRPVPTINLTADEFAAVTGRAIEDDRVPHGPRLDPLRAAITGMNAALSPADKGFPGDEL